jgi:excisionase family DNA binding protein
LSVEEASEQLHCCSKAILMAIKHKRLKADRPFGTRRWLITPEALRDFVAGRQEDEVL